MLFQKPHGVLLFLFVVVTAYSSASSSDSTYAKRRLSDAVNSYSQIHTPVLSYDGSRLFFARKYHPENTGGSKDPDDIWFAERYNGNHWSEPLRVDTPINTRLSNVLFSISKKGNMALLGSTFSLAEGVKQVFTLVEFNDAQWLSSEPITIRNYENLSSNFYASMSPDMRVLLLAIQAKDSRGSLDLYVCFREGNSKTWTAPRNLGMTINTKGTEGSPFLGYDGETLYFSSNGHKGYGSQDLFVSRRLDSTWTKWSEPINLGADINTPGLDHCFSLAHDGTTAYIISSDTANPQTGIYEVTLPQQARISRNIYDSVNVSLPPLSDTLTFSFHYNAGSAEIAQKEAQQFGELLSDKKWVVHQVIIGGHTDTTGSDAFNQQLSVQRAEHVRRLFDKTRPYVGAPQCKGYGSAQPVADNTSEEGKARNRRTEVVVIRMDANTYLEGKKP